MKLFRKPPQSPVAAAIAAHYAALEKAPMVERKPAMLDKPTSTPEEALEAVKAMVDLGCKFEMGRCPDTGALMWVYRAPREHAAACDRLAAPIPYSQFSVAVHCFPGSIKPGTPPPPVR